MSQLKRIIVGHDLRTGGETALKSAVVLARQCDAALRLVHAVEPHHLYQMISHRMASKNSLEEIVQKGGEKLQKIVASRELEGLRADYLMHVGKPFVEIILAGRAWEADLIIVGGPSQHQSHFLGGTGERVMRKAPVPVLVARKPLTDQAKRFLVPTDFSAGAQKAAEEALALARSFGGRIYFLHVLDLTPLYAYDYEGAIGTSLPVPPLTPEDFDADWESFLSNLPLGRISWEKRTEEGRAATTIVQYSQSIQADVIVMDTHGRSGLEHMLLGSVPRGSGVRRAEAVARTAPCPVLTVRLEGFQFQLP